MKVAVMPHCATRLGLLTEFSHRLYAFHPQFGTPVQ